MIRRLLEDCRTFRTPPFEILLTLNIPESKDFIREFDDLPIIVIENQSPKGFGENHNSAFKCCRGDVFMIFNPDISAPQLDLAKIVEFASLPGVGACAPKVVNSGGSVEDSARRFPTISKLIRRVLLRRREADYNLNASTTITVDWVAGMFVAFPRGAFEAVRGFDTRYFMYMEDADICRRLRHRGYRTLVDCSTTVVHDAQRASRRSIRHLSWHLRSALRFLAGI
jgi:N-acetylglucosaminyl-diphospho-decaprenol L-rhamnosyltransferase